MQHSLCRTASCASVLVLAVAVGVPNSVGPTSRWKRNDAIWTSPGRRRAKASAICSPGKTALFLSFPYVRPEPVLVK
eukprot:COSAG06_NODE_1283_length_10013_cov_81.204156_7_plen_77_part_00